MPNVKWLRALVAVVHSPSLTEAAERLHLTQSAVSRMIANLEAELGFLLFTRKGGRLTITPQGEAFYEEAERALSGLDDLERAGASIRGGASVKLRLFSMSSFVRDLIPAALAEISVEYPTLSVYLEIRGGRDFITWDAGRRYDLGLVVLPLDRRSPQSRAFAKVPALAVIPKGHPLVRQEKVTLADLSRERLIMLPATSLVRRWIDGRFAEIRQAPAARIETSAMVAACPFVARGLGVTIADPLAVRSVGFTDLVVRPLSPAMEIGYSFVLRPDTEPGPILQRFMDVLRLEAEKLVHSAVE